MWIFKCIVYVTYNSSVFKCFIVWQKSNRMYWRYILLLKVHSVAEGTFCCWRYILMYLKVHSVAECTFSCTWRYILLLKVHSVAEGAFCCWRYILMYLKVHSVAEGTSCCWRYILLLKVHSHVSSHSLLSWCLFVCSGSLLTVFFWIILYDSYLNVLILNSFLVSVCNPFFLHYQTIISFSSVSMNKFWVTAAGDIPF